MPAPGWFQATDYFYNKLAQMQESTSSYSAQDLLDAFNSGGYQVMGLTGAQLNASSEGLYRHFVEYGNAENVSPNNYFNLATYKANKIAQCQEIGAVPPAGFDSWTEEALDAAMANAGLSYWDHYIQYGTQEGINPSASFNTNQYLSDKLTQLNNMQPPYPLPDGTLGEWTRADLCEALRDAGWNALEHYMLYNTVENIGYVPGPESPASTVNLTTGVDVLGDNGISTNFVATVATTTSKSTLNTGDQITGSNGDDTLTVNMDRQWNGFGDNGFVKGVPEISLNNNTANGDVLTFNANNVQGAETYNIDGNIGLSNLAQPGITVNFSNVKTTENIGLGFNSTAVSGTNDTLTIGMDNVKASGGITTNGIENIVINATGVASSVPLKYMAGSVNLKVTGDADVSFGNVAPSIRNVDLTEATGDDFVCTRRADEIESIKLGQGDDRTTVRNITPDAVLDGGDGNDRVDLYNTTGAYQFQMDDVETLNIRAGKNFDDQPVPDTSASLILDGSNTTGLQNVKLGGGNGIALAGGAAQARDITLVNYDIDDLPIAVEGQNNVNLTVTEVTDVAINVGDGDNSTTDNITGTVTLTDAESVAVNVADNEKASFDAAVNAGNATSLSLSNAQNSVLNVSGGDLSAVSQVAVAGYGDVDISGANVGNESNNVNVNAQNLIGGTFTSQFVGNTYTSGTTHTASLNFTGSTTGQSVVTVDNTYTNVVLNTGINNDKVTLDAGNGDGFKYTKTNLTGSLGYGEDTLIVKGNVLAGSDFSGLTGVETIQFAGMTTTQALKFVDDNKIVIPDTWDVVGGDSIGVDEVPSDPGTVDTETGVPVVGDINTSNPVDLDGSKSGVDVAFGDGSGSKQLVVTEAGDMTITGGAQANSVTGDLTAAQLKGNYTLNNSAGQAIDTVSQSVAATGAVSATGNDNAASTFDFAVTGGTSATIDAGQAKDATVAVSGVAGPVEVTTGDNGSTVTVNDPTATGVQVTTGAGADTVTVAQAAGKANVSVNTGAGNDTATLTGYDGTGANTLTVDLGEGTNTLVADDQNLTGTDATIKNAAITIGEGKTFNVGNNWANLDEVSIAGPGDLEFTSNVDLSKVTSVPVTADMVIDKGTTVSVGDNLGTTGQLNPTSITGDGTLNIASGDVNLAGENAPTVSTAITVAGGASLAMGANLAQATNGITGAGTLKVTANASAPDAAIKVADVNVGKDATLTVDTNNFGKTDKFQATTVDGDGTLALTGDVTLAAGMPAIKTSTLDIAGKLDVADQFDTITSGTIQGTGTLDFSQNAILFKAAGEGETVPTIKTAIAVEDGATLTLTKGDALTAWLGESKQVSGDGTVAFDDAVNLSGATTLPFAQTITLSTEGGEITFGTNINDAKFTLTGDKNLVVDLLDGTGSKVDVSGIQDDQTTAFSGTFEIKADAGDEITLGALAETVVIGETAAAPAALADASAGVVISGFDTASDSISLAGSLDSFDYGTTANNVEEYTGQSSGAVGNNGASQATGGSAGIFEWSYDVTVSNGVTGVDVSASQTVAYDALGSDNKIYALDSNISAADSGAISALFKADSFTVLATQTHANGTSVDVAFDNGSVTGLYLADGSDAMLAVNNGANTNLWYVNNGDTAGLGDLTISLIGTIDGVDDPANLAGVFA